MGKLVTSEFKTHNAKQFVESLDETANSLYYVTLGKHTAFADDNSPPVPGSSNEDKFYQQFRDMIYGKQITTSDISHMITRYTWTSGTVYAQYDHTVDLRDQKFFVVVQEDGGDYSVFKCLYNHKGAPSTDKPSILEISPDDDVYITTGDSYQWKFMFGIPEATFTKFSTSTKIPIVANTEVSGNAVAGSIDVVDVKAGGSRYFSVANGIVKIAAVAGNSQIIELESLTGANLNITTANGTFQIEKIDLVGKYGNGEPDTSNNVANGIVLEANSTFLRVTDIKGNFFGETSNVFVVGQTSNAYGTISSAVSATSSLSANTDFYKGSTFYVTAGAGAGQAKTISEYVVTGSARRIVIPSTFATSIDTTSLFEITPRVVISGDGQSAEGRAIVNTSTFAVDTIEMTNRGSGYSYATAQVLGNTGITSNGSTLQANNANVVPIISPKGGHGSDPINELFGSTVGISVDFLDDEGGNLPAVNDFRTVSILKDPLFANVVITLGGNTQLSGGGSGSGTSFQDGETVTQESTGAFGIVTTRTAGTINLANVYGQFVGGVADSNTTHRLVGNTSGTTSHCSDFQTNERSSSDFTTFDQRTRLLQFNTESSQPFQTDELIIQDSTDAQGIIHSINSSSIVAVTNKKGNFLESESTSPVYVRGQTSEAVGLFNDEGGPDITPHTGEFIYSENVSPITRDDNQTERVKLMIEF